MNEPPVRGKTLICCDACKKYGARTRQPALAFELQAYVQEANWGFKLFNEKSAFVLARRASAEHIAAASGAVTMG